jgi:hypothetical protein
MPASNRTGMTDIGGLVIGAGVMAVISAILWSIYK